MNQFTDKIVEVLFSAFENAKKSLRTTLAGLIIVGFALTMLFYRNHFFALPSDWSTLIERFVYASLLVFFAGDKNPPPANTPPESDPHI